MACDQSGETLRAAPTQLEGGKRVANSCAKTAWELWRNGTVVFNNSFYYTRSWYTLWLVNCDCLLQHCRQLFSFASAEEVGFMACSRFYRHPVFGVIQHVQVNTACKPRSLNLRSAVCGTVCSLHMSHALLSLDQWIVNYTFCIELNFLFRGPPRGRGKCPLNIGVPWVEVGVGPFISNLPTKKINIFLICPGIFTQPAVSTLKRLGNEQNIKINFSMRCCVLNSHICSTSI